MQRNLRTFASLLASALAATIINGCSWNVQIDGRGAGGPRDGRNFTNGGPHESGIRVERFDDVAYEFQSKSTVTPRGGPVRLQVSSADPAPSPPCAEGEYPDFQAHYHPSAQMDAVTVEFASPPVVEFVSGWLYFKGKAPIGKTRRVRAIGSGTEMLIEITDDADYVYVLGEATSRVFVYAIQEDGSETLCRTLTVGQFVRVYDARDEAGRITRRCDEAANYMDDEKRREAVVQATEEARE